MREKILSNPSLHDGLMFLIYEHINIHYVQKFIEVKSVEGFSKIEDSGGMHLKEDDAPKIKGKEKELALKDSISTKKK